MKGKNFRADKSCVKVAVQNWNLQVFAFTTTNIR